MDASLELQKLMRLNLKLSDRERADDVRQAAAEYILKGRDLDKALRFARRECKRMFAPSGFVSLDQRKEEDGHSAHERLAAVDPADIVDFQRSRLAIFDEQTEAVLAVARDGAAALGRAAGLTARRGQQIVKAQIERAREEKRFSDGGKGQGGLFCFDGEVA